MAMKLKISDASSDEIRASYLLTRVPSNVSLNIALVERGLEVQVRAGENAGRLAKHDNIVREFKIIPVKEIQGEIAFAKPPKTSDMSHFSIIAFLQNISDKKIIDANSVDLAGM